MKFFEGANPRELDGEEELFKKENEISTKGLSFEPVEKKLDFNKDESNVIKAINNSLGKKQFNSHLLHGVTGSGKTEIFIEVIKTVIKKNLNICLP